MFKINPFRTRSSLWRWFAEEIKLLLFLAVWPLARTLWMQLSGATQYNYLKSWDAAEALMLGQIGQNEEIK